MAMILFDRNSIWDFNHALFIAGRMLLICQKFESNCKYSLSLLIPTLEKDNEISSLDILIKKYDENNKLFLGQLNNKAKKHNLDNIVIADIEKAIKSRNFICHELLKEIISNSDTHFTEFLKKKKIKTKADALAYVIEFGCPSQPKKDYKFDEKILLSHVAHIACGDFWVTKMGYEMSEKEPFPKSKKKYISETINFILESSEYNLIKE